MSSVKVKKVKPYPIAAQFSGAGGSIPGSILKLVMKGFIADMLGKPLKVGDLLQVSFDLPVIKANITQMVKIMKTYDRPNLQTHAIDRLAEFHFSLISDEHGNQIYTFLQMIRQDDIM